MVKNIGPNQMKVTTEKAVALDKEVSTGRGTPLDRRIAEAILENAKNLQQQSDFLKASADAMNDAIKALDTTREEVAALSKRTNEACISSDRINTHVLDVVGWGAKEAVIAAIPAGIDETICKAREELAWCSSQSTKAIEEAGDKAARTIETIESSAKKWGERANKRSWFMSLRTAAKAVVIVAVTCCVALTLLAGWRCLPLVTGEAQITYTAAYQSELDSTKIELQKTQNELQAYKDAYPEGLSEQRLHDLNTKNGAAESSQ